MKAKFNMDQYPHYSRAPIARLVSAKDWRKFKQGKEVNIKNKDAVEKLVPGLFVFIEDSLASQAIALENERFEKA